MTQTPSTTTNSNTEKFTSITLPSQFQELLFTLCEEVELISRDYSNDEGQGSSVAAGERLNVQTEHPDVLLEEGIKQSALQHVPMPQPDWENPVPEDTHDEKTQRYQSAKIYMARYILCMDG